VVRDFPRRAGDPLRAGLRAADRHWRRLRLVSLAIVLAAAVALGGVPLAQAGPDDDKRRVERELDAAREHLDGSSARLASATRSFKAAEVKLATARTHLARARGQVSAAKARDTSLARQLSKARRAADKVRRDVARAERRVRMQHDEIIAFANASYQGSTMTGLAGILRSQSPADLLGRLHIVASVSESQRTAFERLQAAKSDVTGLQAARELAEAEVQANREVAADSLARTRVLERRARAAEASVAEIVDDRRAARAEAEDARADDLRRYRVLQAERRRIQAVLEELARKERESGGGGGGSLDLTKPVDAPVTSPYGMRFHPVLQVWKLHDGTDFGAGCGVSIRAAASGEVIERYFNEGYGNRVLVSHGTLDGKSTVTAYNHLSGYAVSVGEQVSRGEVVGYVGSTGYSTGCHLHFMLYRNGGTVDPMDYL
jgi:murein DD-endopeptidase MepM/ murein hydrolase activator NlpD